MRMKKTTTTTPSSSRCRTQKSVSYEWRPFEAPSKVPRPPPCGSTGSCATRTRRTDLHLRVRADGAFGRSLNSARTKDLTFQAPKRDFLVPDAPKTSTLCTPHKLGRDPWLLICTWGSAQTRDLAIPVELSSIARAAWPTEVWRIETGLPSLWLLSDPVPPCRATSQGYARF